MGLMSNEQAGSNLFPSRPLSLLLAASLLAVIAFVLLIDLLPPMGRDSLIHHLAIPKLWLQAGAMVEIPWSRFSYYPMNLELLYLIPLALDADWAARLIHHAFGLLSGWLIFQYVRPRLGFNWGLLASLLFVSTPMVMRLSSSAYVDLGLVFFITASWMCLVRWAETGKILYFILSGISLGLALGTKYNALIAPVLFIPSVMIIRSRAGDRTGRCILWGLLFTALFLLPFAPWLIKNYLWTGNPIYPLYNRVWGLDSLAPPGFESVGLFNQRRYLYGESFLEILLVPLRVFLQGK
ncbi:MAG: glycosyltransferase family 39 protein, partial [Deltaproteobacteria bacterium]|nr:glycosyltransferase family 39 protein [Deltaproteobacteria bacterium]